MTTPLPAHQWRTGDVVVPDHGHPRRITLHRVQGAPGDAVVHYAGTDAEHHYPLSHTELIRRPQP